jgi:isopenicillin N synthase-like dioxygenase
VRSFSFIGASHDDVSDDSPRSIARRVMHASDSVPRVSLIKLADGDDVEIARLGEALTSSERVGYFELDARDVGEASTSRVAPFDVARTYDIARTFFSLPEDVKALYVHSQYANESGGFVPLLEEYSYQKKTAALVESFDVVRELSSCEIEQVRDERGDDAARGLGPMDWPVEVPAMQSAFCSFYSACDGAARTLYRCFAKALHVDDEDVWVKKFGNTSHCSMRAMRYPSMKVGDEANEEDSTTRRSERIAASKVEIVGISEHTDFEFFTLLHQTCEGLELQGRDGAWRSAPAYENEAIFTCILSDAFEIFTNGVVRATPHRVRPSRDGRDRLSLVRFNGLNDDAVIAPLPQFVTPHRPLNAAYEPRTQGDHVGQNVTRASDNLADMIDKQVYPKSELTRPPKRFAQLLVLDVANGRILLGKHTRGEFAGRYTGFIAEVDSEKDLVPLDVARSVALEEAGLNPLACDALNDPKDLFEAARFVFRGWMPDGGLAVEHEFVCAFRDGTSVAKLFPTHARASADIIPTWFQQQEIPYADMPEDDAIWYPIVLGRFSKHDGVDESLVIGHFDFSGDEGELTDHAVHEVEFRHSSFNRSSTARVLARLERLEGRSV